MALIATLAEPVVITDLELVDPYAYGDLTTPFTLDVAPTGFSAILANRFPTPPAAFGFLTDVLDAVSDPAGIAGVLTGAVYPESGYLEPTIGQIWPRIG